MAYQPTGKPPGRPRKEQATDTQKDETMTEPTPITETAEFKVALAEMAAKQSADFEQKMSEFRASIADTIAQAVANGSVPATMHGQPTELRSMLSDLTVAITSATEQPGGRKPVSPIEAERRQKAWDKMGERVMLVVKNREKPHYEVASRTHLAFQMIEPWTQNAAGKSVRTEIIWNGVPNNSLRPVNDVAREVYALYLEGVGGSTADPSGRKEMPAYMGVGGVIYANSPSQSMAAHGTLDAPQPMELSDLLPTNQIITSVDDPNATYVPTLGTIAPPAERTAPGSQPKLSWPDR